VAELGTRTGFVMRMLERSRTIESLVNRAQPPPGVKAQVGRRALEIGATTGEVAGVGRQRG
jgi:hypothetical protein